ncbi:MAG: putative selenate reductase subunit YgfK [Treponema sp.]|jgi:putative selenate reductase|nr:putative selenate reductase subunit YgfK [Treponema sp.]
MSEIMRPIPFDELVLWIAGEYAGQGSVFNIRKEKFYRNESGKGVTLYGTKLGSPLGPAAGPHTQLAQNIVSAYLAGSRFFELKTVQVMDGEELRKCVPRPCISAVDEGYNVEWSTELTVREAFDEYVKAWFLLHLLSKEAGINAGERDFEFNMSVGYNYDGIVSPKIDGFIEGLKDASRTPVWKSCYQQLEDRASLFKRFTPGDLKSISPNVASNITLSTLHGCPKEEIEKIARYLISKKKLHTCVKCNPTLLGYQTARTILDSMGYGYVSFDDHHFKDDLRFDDAVSMIRRLMTESEKEGLSFGVKITNTFPVEIKREELPGSEMYMSGRALFPLSITVADKLSQAFGGKLPVSYAGGADYFNLESILKTGIRPVTMATAILKPGGYERMKQLAQLAEDCAPYGQGDVDAAALHALAASVTGNVRYAKSYRHGGLRKSSSRLPLFDCYKAPCGSGGCPIEQRIPEYLAETAAGNYDRAFALIAEDNPAPSITGTICDHQCQNRCTRADYDDPLEIRRSKLSAARRAQDAYVAGLKKPSDKTDKSAGIIGAGPAGLAAAVYLRRNGVPVTVYEKHDKPFGAVSRVIPGFRIGPAEIEKDFSIPLKLGAEFKFNCEVRSVAELKKKHAFVIIAAGAWKEGVSPVKEGSASVIDALKFLEDSRKSDLSLDLGRSVAVIGGGDVAMDCARAAKRNRGVEKVTVVYRRTRDFMPAQDEEFELALKDGVEFKWLLAPESFVNGVLSCEVQKLGDYDSGRRSITGTGEKTALGFDTVIGAVGARVDTRVFSENGIPLNEKGFPILNARNESSIGNVYVAGDCRTGAATVVKAMADSRIIALDILSKLGMAGDFGHRKVRELEAKELYEKRGIIAPAQSGDSDGFRCLSCDALCEVCAEVCPNRANIVIEAPGFLFKRQIVHLDRMCNECGNCTGFCPHSGEPSKDKFTIFSSLEDFKDSENKGVLFENHGVVVARLEDGSVTRCGPEGGELPRPYKTVVETLLAKYGYMIGGVQ